MLIPDSSNMLLNSQLLVVIIFITVSFFSCSERNHREHFSHDRIYKAPNEIFKSITLDTIPLHISTTSYVGDFYMFEDKLYFVDKIFCLVNEVSVDGELISSHLGKGSGPNEVPRLMGFLATDNGFVITHDWVYYVYDTSWTLKEKFTTNWNEYASKNLMQNPDPSNLGMYEVQYFNNVLRYNSQTNELVTKVVTEHITFNAFISSEYYKESRVLGSINLEDRKVTSVFGRFSPAFERYKFIPFHAFMDYDICGDNFYLTYEPDSLIYVYDLTFKPLYAFGSTGYGLNHSYHETSQLEVFEDTELLKLTRENEGYYEFIKAFKSGVVFRSYQQDSGDKRLQIYKHNQLIGDVAIPRRFRIIGYIEPYYYADGIVDEENEKLAFYKFQLSTE